MAKSNLRNKGQTFNFGMAADFSDSEEEEKEPQPEEPVDETEQDTA